MIEAPMGAVLVTQHATRSIWPEVAIIPTSFDLTQSFALSASVWGIVENPVWKLVDLAITITVNARLKSTL